MLKMWQSTANKLKCVGVQKKGRQQYFVHNYNNWSPMATKVVLVVVVLGVVAVIRFSKY